MSNRQSFSLVQYFSDFYQEIAALKQAISDGNLPIYLAGDSKTETDKHSLASMMALRLYSFLAKQAKEVRELGNEQERQAYRMAQYVMAALADEIFIIELEWDGNDVWADYLLEKRLFKTSMAGRNLFQYSSRLLKSRTHGPLQRELGIIFLMAIQLGFKGEHTGKKGYEHLKGLRKDLLHFIGYSAESELPAFPQAEQIDYKMSKPYGKRLAPLSRWYWIGTFCLIAYLIVSTGIWYRTSTEITDVLPSRCDRLHHKCSKLGPEAAQPCFQRLKSQCPAYANNLSLAELMQSVQSAAKEEEEVIKSAASKTKKVVKGFVKEVESDNE